NSVLITFFLSSKIETLAPARTSPVLASLTTTSASRPQIGFAKKISSSPVLFEENNPISIFWLKVNAKSSFSLFTGLPKFCASDAFASSLKTSNPPKPGFPLEEKYNVPSSAINGKFSFPSVLTLLPKFTGSPYVSLAFTSTFQISVSPKPPGISEAKYNFLPSWLKLGLPTLYSVLLNGRALMSVHLPSLLTALYNHKVPFFTSKALSFSYSLSLWLSPVKNIVLPSLLIATVPSCHFVFTSFTAVGSEKVPSLKTAL